MIKKTILCNISAAILLSAAHAQKPSDHGLGESPLLKEIESLGGSSTPLPKLPGSSLDVVENAPRTTAAADGKDESAAKKEKGPTVITAMEASFDQKANQAIFTGSVVVNDPEFNVKCDKLTAYLNHTEKGAPEKNGTKPSASPKPAAPKNGDAKKSGGAGGLQRAIAEAAPGNVVLITQDKKEADGSITHGVGHARKATYNAATGDIILTGRPDVQQGLNLVTATDDGTVITLNRDGKMKAVGPHKTTIVDKGDSGI